MIVMKFGGTSVGDAAGILGAADIVAGQRDRRPIVVVSALAGVTDLLVDAVAAAGRGERERLEPVLADVGRRHRWAIAGAISEPARRHDLSLEVDRLLEELQQLLRSVRILGEGTPRASDALLAFGEILSSKIVAAALADRGLPALWVDPREVMVTDGRHGRAEPLLDPLRERAAERLARPASQGSVPVVGGFVGATVEGRTTTLGRGGSDTSAAVLGAAIGAEEIQIWTDVDGILTADPRIVPGARTRPEVSFAEAAELAYYGAKVLHPASIEPAVQRRIPVRVLNSLRPEGRGTVIVDERADAVGGIASVASRGRVKTVRVFGRKLRMEPGFLPEVMAAFDAEGIVPDLAVASEVAVTVVIPSGRELDGVARRLGARMDTAEDRGIVCVVGIGLARSEDVRTRVLAALASLGPEIVALGGSATSIAAVVPEARLGDAVRDLHRRFFEERASA